MNNPFRLVLIVNTFALMAGPVFGETGLPAQALPVHLYNHAGAPADLVHSATEKSSRLFRAVRISINWEYLSTEPPEDQGTDMTSALFQQPDTRRYIVVQLIIGLPASVYPGALGYALPFARKGAHVVIFYNRVETLARGTNQPTHIVLGYAIAHEIGHVLLGSSKHASGGLMQARWTATTWRLAASGLLVFSRQETETMGAGVQRLQARQLSPVQQPALAFSSLPHFPE